MVKSTIFIIKKLSLSLIFQPKFLFAKSSIKTVAYEPFGKIKSKLQDLFNLSYLQDKISGNTTASLLYPFSVISLSSYFCSIFKASSLALKTSLPGSKPVGVISLFLKSSIIFSFIDFGVKSFSFFIS